MSEPNFWSERRVYYQNRFAGRPWTESLETVISNVADASQVCRSYALPIVEIKALWFFLLCQIEALMTLRDKPNTEDLQRLFVAMQDFQRAFYMRGNEDSPQAKYHEVCLSSRRALGERHNSLLDQFSHLVAIFRTVCSGEAANYLDREVGLDAEQFLDMVHMLANDHSNPATVANPPARVRLALSRQRRRREKLNRERWMPPTPEQAFGAIKSFTSDSELDDPRMIESNAIAKADWERGRTAVALPPDHVLAVEAKIEGLNLQSSEARQYLGWSPSKLDSVRRSLEPDRPWGKKLRERFAAYHPEGTEKTKERNLEKLS